MFKVKKRDCHRYCFILMLFSAVLFTACNNHKKSEKIMNQKEMQTRQNARDAILWSRLIFEQKEQCFNDFFDSLTLEEKICQLFIENLEGKNNFAPVEKLRDISGNSQIPEEKYIIPGGYLFFSFNIADTPEQIINFTDSIFDYCNKNELIPPFLAIDQEGGYVNRLKKINGPLPSAQTVAEKSTAENAGALYAAQGKQMNLLGFQMNLAPLAEICTPDNQDFLAERSFGNADKVFEYGKACINAYESQGISAVLKHFPGNTNTDPHTGLPEIKLSENELFKMLKPFEELIKQKPSGILMSHARTSAIDSEKPSCLSQIWVTDILRNKYNYEGIIFSDDIFMAALAENGYDSKKAVIMAIEAGIDCIMVSEKRILKPAKFLYQKAKEDSAFEEKINAAARRILLYKLQNGQLEIVEDLSAASEALPFGYKITSDNFYKKQDNKEERLSDFLKAKEENQKLYESFYK